MRVFNDIRHFQSPRPSGAMNSIRHRLTLPFAKTFTLLVAVLLLCFGPIFPAHAQAGFQDLHDFGSSGDGSKPQDGAVLGSDGHTLYGMTNQGGDYGQGTIFGYDLITHTYTKLHDFAGTRTDGGNPVDTMTLSTDGKTLYGLASTGGAYGGGVIFAFDPNTRICTDLHDFGGSDDGLNPYGSLTLSHDGKTVYGMTSAGGPEGGGNLFAYDLSLKSYTVLHNLGGPGDGSDPGGNLTLGGDGKTLYGMTYGGGSYGRGIILSYNLSTKSYTKLHDFSGSSSDGSNPMASLTLGGDGHTLYGTTMYGGANNGGILFSYDPSVKGSGAFKDLVNLGVAYFGMANIGADPEGNLTLGPDGYTLLGMTWSGGGNDDILFSYDPRASAYQVLLDLGNPGYNATARGDVLVSRDSHTLYDMTEFGGANGLGILFSLKIDAPIASNDSYSVQYNANLSVSAPGVLANDTTGGPATAATLVSNPAHGSLTLNSDGSFTYTPKTGFIGHDSFTYRVASALYQGNTATVTLTVLKPAPVTTATVSPTAPNGKNNWYTVPVTVTLHATAATSPIKILYTLNSTTWQVYTGPIKVSADGHYGLWYVSQAPGCSTETRHRINFAIDHTPPITYGIEQSVTNGTQISLLASDNLSGGAQTVYSLDGSTPQVYRAPFTVSATSKHTITCHSIDKAGNVEANKTLTWTTSGPTPTTTATLDPPSPNGNNGWYTVPVTVTLTASAPASLGAITSFYCIDGGLWQVYTKPFTIGNDAMHTVTYFSQTPQSSPETAHNISFNIDSTPPVTGSNLVYYPPQYGFFGPISPGHYVLFLYPGDNLSGVATTVYSIWTLTLKGYGWSQYWTYPGVNQLWSPGIPVEAGSKIRYHSVDNAGNVEADKTFTF